MVGISCVIWSFAVLLSMLLLGLFFALLLLAIREILLGRRSRSWTRGTRGVALLATVLLAVVFFCPVPLNSIRECLEAPYSNPPSTFRDSDLLGTWEAHYSRSTDTLIIKADGTFRQIYEDHYVQEYVYQTPWNEWWVERFPDGRVRVHLHGARFYEEGIRVAEEGAGLERWKFYDPVAHDSVDTRTELILNVRIDSSGELILYHMWSPADEGFAMIGCERNLFRRMDTP